MILSFVFAFIVGGIICVITEEQRLESIPVELPWNLYQDKVKLAAGYIRWSDKKQDSGHSHSI